MQRPGPRDRARGSGRRPRHSARRLRRRALAPGNRGRRPQRSASSAYLADQASPPRVDLRPMKMERAEHASAGDGRSHRLRCLRIADKRVDDVKSCASSCHVTGRPAQEATDFQGCLSSKIVSGTEQDVGFVAAKQIQRRGFVGHNTNYAVHARDGVRSRLLDRRQSCSGHPRRGEAAEESAKRSRSETQEYRGSASTYSASPAHRYSS